MPIITEAELRDRVRQPTHGMKLSLQKGTMFSPSAADFIKQWQIEVVYEEPPAAVESRTAAEPPSWQKPAVFPVKLEGDIPHCVTCGTPLKLKPEHMTQLNATTFAPKDHDRIRLRGKIDSLHALCLLIGGMAKDQNAPWLTSLLETLAAYCREMISAEYNERQVAPLTINGLDEAALRKTTHDPQAALGLAHLTPNTQDVGLLLWLNYLRCQAREAEVVAIETFGNASNEAECFGLVQAMNRLSSAVYYLELLVKQRDNQLS